MAVRTATPRTAVPNEPRPNAEDDEQDEVTRPSDLGFGPRPQMEVEVQPIQLPRDVDADGMVRIRMARTIDEFTFGNPHVAHKLEEGRVYRMPVDVARYLHSIDALTPF